MEVRGDCAYDRLGLIPAKMKIGPSAARSENWLHALHMQYHEKECNTHPEIAHPKERFSWLKENKYCRATG